MSKKPAATFEDECGRAFDAYFKADIASIDFMPVPTKVIGFGPMGPKLVFDGKAPYDAYGFFHRGARMIGAEFKLNSKPETSLAIVKKGGDGAGLEHHQLDALAKLAARGGIARVVWNNGGEIGVLREEGIIRAYTSFTAGVKAQERGNDAPMGCKSIKWGEFQVVSYAVLAGIICFDWLLWEKIQ